FRVELGEIEAALYRHPAVSEAVVVLDRSAGDPRIIGYVVSRPDQDPSAQELRSFLARELPAYMVPAALLFLPALPLSPSGKLDRRALPLLDGSHREAEWEIVLPRSPLEETLAEIWADVLNVERVGIHDDFFALGGHSLKATQVIAQVREALEIDLPVRSLFEAPTVAGLAVAVVRRAAELTDDEDFMEVMQEVRGA
ncbi:MAG TPA: phosphopantetheine-binding protein, partial [Thermoanaerobaculia bacterium]|nr:phosphopantetheine-binding protein [Thermoanaerobaculia bacterium]